MNRAEQNYNTTEKELLVIVWAIKHFRPYVYGTKFRIVTDHKPLIWLFNVNDPGSRLIRWRLKLEEHNYKIVHKAGRANANTDALSRNVKRDDDEMKRDRLVLTLEKEEDNADKDARIYTEDEKKKILYEYHDAPIGRHQGIERTTNRIRLMHNWKGYQKTSRITLKNANFARKINCHKRQKYL